ncbi:hypothetical protein BO99DRAFT_184030 [Aspergillus violaceofuscus CBS 115571]|uniref:Uncharacterized protein n=1 Tax=Aspergillus violaceofuscus (strain CBS 115571) TaxID=1450538 RepID=A0A2V5H1T3_ASPV1|nr:hypothetical protein BO99DRAFT_184030 [Aspergillus violaceofuscus CBS 115571]
MEPYGAVWSSLGPFGPAPLNAIFIPAPDGPEILCPFDFGPLRLADESRRCESLDKTCLLSLMLLSAFASSYSLASVILDSTTPSLFLLLRFIFRFVHCTRDVPRLHPERTGQRVGNTSAQWC